METPPQDAEQLSAVDPGVADDSTYLGTDRRLGDTSERSLGDFTTTLDAPRLVPLALGVGVAGAGISLVLLGLIGFFTNLFY